MMTRRQALKTTVLATAAAATARFANAQSNVIPSNVTAGMNMALAGPFTLPPLPYAFDALEPHIDARTMEIHHDRHHKAYVDNLNKALDGWLEYRMRKNAPYIEGLELLLKDLNSVPEKIRPAVRNQGGGHYNHSLFWQMMKKDGGGEPTGSLAKAIDKHLGSVAKFKEEFSAAAMKVFGSGWTWLILDDKELKVTSTSNQDSPLMHGKHPLLGLD